MKYFILSDIHSNLEALEAVLEDAERRGEGRYVILGDIVGYGASPNESIERVRKLKNAIIIRGNHDRVVAGTDIENDFNAVARAAVEWTKNHLTRENMKFLRSLEIGPLRIDDAFTICHGAPMDEDDYIFSGDDAKNIFKTAAFDVCFFGHTHYAFVFAFDGEMITPYAPRGGRIAIRIEDDLRYLLNPGSIGQPRDRDHRSAYALYDSDTRTVSFVRVPYDTEKAKEKILKEGLPSLLAIRLSLGL